MASINIPNLTAGQVATIVNALVDSVPFDVEFQIVNEPTIVVGFESEVTRDEVERLSDAIDDLIFLNMPDAEFRVSS